jgi:hypothetical protein
MKTYKESNVLLEVRRIKEEVAREAGKAGFEKYYLSLNGKAAKLVEKYRTKRRKSSRRQPA